MPLINWLPETPAIMVSEKTIKVKSSAEPKRSAKVASIPAKRISEILDIKSATQDAYKAISSARRASPRCANG